MEGGRFCCALPYIKVGTCRHGKKSPMITQNFKKLDKSGKANYMRGQKWKREAAAGNPTTVPYDFSDLTGSQESYKDSANLDDVLSRYVPFWRWSLDEQKYWSPSLQKRAACTASKS